MNKFILTISFLISLTTFAGERPPADFLSMPIVSDNGRYQLVSYPVFAFESYFKKKGTVDWDKGDSNSWLMKAGTVDKATGQKNNVTFVLSKGEDRVQVERLLVNNQDSKNLINGLTASIGAEIGKPFKKNTAGKQPPQQFLALKIINGATGGVYSFTTTQVVEYFKSKGATVLWDGPDSQTGEYSLKASQGGKITVVKFTEDNASWEDASGDLKQEPAARMSSNKIISEVAAWSKGKK